MSIIDLIEAPIRLGVDGFISLFEGKGFKPSKSSSRGGGFKQKNNKSFWNNIQNRNWNKNTLKTKKNWLNTSNREELTRVMFNAKKARENLSGLKTWYKPKKNNIFSWLR